MSEVPVVVFDFDGTLVRGDCVARFLIRRIRASQWRRLLAIPLLPLLPLLRGWRFAWIPASGFSWVSTVGSSDAELGAALDAEVARLARDRERWLIAPALERLRAHLAAGDRVLIVTGASEELVRPLWAALAPDLADVRLIGSQTRRWLGGRVGRVHLVGERKLQALAQLGLRPPFKAMYSDSANDLPMLLLAEAPVLVAPNARNLRRLRRVLPEAELLAG